MLTLTIGRAVERLAAAAGLAIAMSAWSVALETHPGRCTDRLTGAMPGRLHALTSILRVLSRRN